MRWWGKKTLGKWQTAEIAGHEVHHWEPACRSGPYALLYLHDADSKSLDQIPAASHLIETMNWPVICPQAGACWWLDRIVSEFDATVTPMQWLVSHVIPWAEQHYRITPRGLALLGRGMGGQGVLNLGFIQGTRFPVVVSLQASIAFEQLYGSGSCIDQCFTSPEHARQYTAGMMVNPKQAARSIAIYSDTSDTLWHRGNDRLHEKLRALGLEHSYQVQSSAVEELAQSSWQEQMEFARGYIREAMRAESRRLL